MIFKIIYYNLNTLGKKYGFETVLKIHTVILSEAKNLLFFFSSQKIKKGDPSALRPQDDTER
jgi:hypothetical protein